MVIFHEFSMNFLTVSFLRREAEDDEMEQQLSHYKERIPQISQNFPVLSEFFKSKKLEKSTLELVKNKIISEKLNNRKMLIFEQMKDQVRNSCFLFLEKIMKRLGFFSRI